MVSVIIATYNGERYILEQLKSIKNQSREVDEVLIFDDLSKDKTFEICENFIKGNNLKNWKLHKNDKNLGYRENFFYGIKKASGDIIFLCDQDDIWLENKVEVMEKVMLENKNILSLASNFSRCDENGNIICKYVKHPYKKRGKLRKISQIEFLKFHTYLGMTMAISKEIIKLIKFSDKCDITHDIIINLYAAEKSGLYYLDLPLTIRRSYSLSTGNNRILKEIENVFGSNPKLQYLSRKIKLFDISQFDLKDKEYIEKIEVYKKFCEYRYNFIEKQNIFDFIKGMKYIKFYKGIKEYIGDLYFLLKGKRK